MYLQVSIVSADALETAGPEHLSAKASLSIYIYQFVFFNSGTTGVKS